MQCIPGATSEQLLPAPTGSVPQSSVPVPAPYINKQNGGETRKYLPLKTVGAPLVHPIRHIEFDRVGNVGSATGNLVVFARVA